MTDMKTQIFTREQLIQEKKSTQNIMFALSVGKFECKKTFQV